MAKSAFEERRRVHSVIISRLRTGPGQQQRLGLIPLLPKDYSWFWGEIFQDLKKPPAVPNAALGLFQKINYGGFLPVQVLFPTQSVKWPCYPAFKKPMQLNSRAIKCPDSSPTPTSLDKVRCSHTLTDARTPYLTARHSADMKTYVRSPGLKCAQHSVTKTE